MSKTRALLLTPAEVTSCLAGPTTLRRVLKPQPPAETTSMGYFASTGLWVAMQSKEFLGAPLDRQVWRCPAGTVGETRWVREAFTLFDDDAYGALRFDDGTEYHCPATPLEDDDPNAWWDVLWERVGARRLSPIILPQWASRLTLTVQAVTVEQAAGGWVWVVTVEDTRP